MSALRRLHVLVATLLAIAAGLVSLSTFFVPGPSIPGWLVWPLFVLVFPVFGAALVPVALSANRSMPRTRWTDFSGRMAQSRQFQQGLIGRVPRVARFLIAGAFVAGWLAGMSSLGGSLGQPERHGDQYFSNNHGSLVPLTRTQYEHQVALGYRRFDGTAMAFYAVAAGLVLAGPTRRRD